MITFLKCLFGILFEMTKRKYGLMSYTDLVTGAFAGVVTTGMGVGLLLMPGDSSSLEVSVSEISSSGESINYLSGINAESLTRGEGWLLLSLGLATLVYTVVNTSNRVRHDIRTRN